MRGSEIRPLTVLDTPLIADREQAGLLLKLEGLQPGGSYKIRGVERFLKTLVGVKQVRGIL